MSFSKTRFRSKRKGKAPQYNANGQGVTTAKLSNEMYSVTEDRETLMGFTGNLSVRPSTATGAAFFSIQILRSLPSVATIDPQNDSTAYERYSRLWDYIVSMDAGATESTMVNIVSKKRRKLWKGDRLFIVYLSNVANVAIFSIQIKGFQLLLV